MCEIMCIGALGVCALAAFIAAFYFLFGVIFLALASSALTSISTYSDLLPNDDLTLFPILCIAIGCLFTLLTIMGILGIKKGGRKGQIVYLIAQLLVVLLGLYIYIDAYPNEKQLDKQLFEGLNASIHNYGLDVTHGEKSVTHHWDNLQSDLECCGVKNYLDWERLKPYGPQSAPTPISCCRSEHRIPGCSIHVRFDHPAEANKIINAQGCLPKVKSELMDIVNILHLFLVPILIMTCFGILTSCCSAGATKNEANMTEKKVGPVVVKMRQMKKSKREQEYDVEAAEREHLQGEGDEEGGEGKTGDEEKGGEGGGEDSSGDQKK